MTVFFSLIGLKHDHSIKKLFLVLKKANLNWRLDQKRVVFRSTMEFFALDNRRQLSNLVMIFADDFFVR